MTTYIEKPTRTESLLSRRAEVIVPGAYCLSLGNSLETKQITTYAMPKKQWGWYNK
jgi:hypothetical protein